MIAPPLPYPVNPALVGIPNLELSEGAGYLAVGTPQRQDVIGFWAKRFFPVNHLGELKDSTRSFIVQLVAGPDDVAIYIGPDLAGFVGKASRPKFQSSVEWLKKNRHPALCQGFFVGGAYTGQKYGLRLRTTGQVIFKLSKNASGYVQSAEDKGSSALLQDYFKFDASNTPIITTNTSNVLYTSVPYTVSWASSWATP